MVDTMLSARGAKMSKFGPLGVTFGQGYSYIQGASPEEISRSGWVTTLQIFTVYTIKYMFSGKGKAPKLTGV